MRFSRAYEQTKEYLARQAGFFFAQVARAVIEIALEAKKKIGGWWNLNRPHAPAPYFKKPHQLVLKLNNMAQTPLLKA